MTLIKRIFKHEEYRNRQRALLYLQAMPVEQLVASGFCPTLIGDGTKSWPWRVDGQTDSLDTILRLLNEERVVVEELQRYSDSDLSDLGLSRGTIISSVRYGRPRVDKHMNLRAA